MVTTNCEEKGLIESLERSLPRSERSGLAHFTHFSVLISSIEVLPKYIASCSFSEVILVLFSNFIGVD